MFIKRRTLHRGSRAKDFIVRITSCRDMTLQGEVRHRTSQNSQYFRSLLELVALIHDRLEELGMPMPAVEMRSWGSPRLGLMKKGEGSMQEEIPTAETTPKVGSTAFLVRIIFRQNATWMGEIHWLEEDKKLYFRSLLEMVMLMQEALDTTGTPPAEYTFRSWEDDVEEAL